MFPKFLIYHLYPHVSSVLSMVHLQVYVSMRSCFCSTILVEHTRHSDGNMLSPCVYGFIQGHFFKTTALFPPLGP